MLITAVLLRLIIERGSESADPAVKQTLRRTVGQLLAWRWNRYAGSADYSDKLRCSVVEGDSPKMLR